MIDFQRLEYYLFVLGNIIPLDIHIDSQLVKQDISRYEEHFKPYNPRKKGYNRYGLSLTSLDGGFSGAPDLDSLYEYNKIHKTNYKESSFRKATPLFQSSVSLKTTLKPFEDSLGRSHILKLDKGGFFPPHRDLSNTSFRLFISLADSPYYTFILNEQKISFRPGQLYCLNTKLTHSLFSFENNSLFIVFNTDLSRQSLQNIYKNLEAT